MKAIQIRFLPATNFNGARMKAWTEGGNSVMLPYQYELSSNMLRADLTAMELMIKMEWDKNCKIVGIGELPNGDYAAVLGCK